MRWTHAALKPHYRGWNGTTADHNYNWHDAIHDAAGNACGPNSPGPLRRPRPRHAHHRHHRRATTARATRSAWPPGAKWIGCRNMDQGNGTPATYTECFQFFIAPTDLSGNNPNPALRPHVMNNSWGCPASEGCAAEHAARPSSTTPRRPASSSKPRRATPARAARTVQRPAGHLRGRVLDRGDRHQQHAGRLQQPRPGRPSTLRTCLKPNISAPGVNVRSA